MDISITWHPTKLDVKTVTQMRLALVVTKDYERILIGKPDDIRWSLDDREASEIVYDETRAFGAFLIELDYDPKGLWNEAISNLMEATGIFSGPQLPRMLNKKSPRPYEERAMEILKEKFDNGDSVSRYVAMRIWYGYWGIRGLEKKELNEAFFAFAQNIVRPFDLRPLPLEPRTSVTPDHHVFRLAKELSICDKESVLYTSLGKDRLECITVEASLLPLKKYYADQISKWKKYIMQCEHCGKIFMADNQHYKYCSDVCKQQVREINLAKRSEHETTAAVDKLCTTANAYWNNRRRKIRKSNEWSEEDVRKYEIAMEMFQAEKVEMRKNFKHGTITFGELKNWLAAQQRRADEALEAIKVTER